MAEAKRTPLPPGFHRGRQDETPISLVILTAVPTSKDKAMTAVELAEWTEMPLQQISNHLQKLYVRRHCERERVASTSRFKYAYWRAPRADFGETEAPNALSSSE